MLRLFAFPQRRCLLSCRPAGISPAMVTCSNLDVGSYHFIPRSGRSACCPAADPLAAFCFAQPMMAAEGLLSQHTETVQLRMVRLGTPLPIKPGKINGYFLARKTPMFCPGASKAALAEGYFASISLPPGTSIGSRSPSFQMAIPSTVIVGSMTFHDISPGA